MFVFRHANIRRNQVSEILLFTLATCAYLFVELQRDRRCKVEHDTHKSRVRIYPGHFSVPPFNSVTVMPDALYSQSIAVSKCARAICKSRVKLARSTEDSSWDFGACMMLSHSPATTAVRRASSKTLLCRRATTELQAETGVVLRGRAESLFDLRHGRLQRCLDLLYLIVVVGVTATIAQG
jgi:hypothetical protein